MRSRVLEIIGGMTIALVVVGMVSSYLLVSFLMVVLPGFGDSVIREASKGPYGMHSLIRMTIFALMMVVVVYLILWAAHYFLTRMSFLKRMSFKRGSVWSCSSYRSSRRVQPSGGGPPTLQSGSEYVGHSHSRRDALLSEFH